MKILIGITCVVDIYYTLELNKLKNLLELRRLNVFLLFFILF